MKTFLRCLLLIFTLIFAPIDSARSAQRPQFEDAIRAYRSGDAAGAIRQFQSLAMLGRSEAQTMLGIMYLKGMGVKADPAIAAVWFYKAARLGQPQAQLLLASLHYEGRGVGRKAGEAYFWARVAAGHGDAHIVVAALRLAQVVAHQLTMDQIHQIDRSVRYWQPVR